MAIQKLEIMPTREPIAQDISGFPMLSFVWERWFGLLRVMLNNMVPSVGEDAGDADSTLTWGKSALTHIYSTALTQARTITLSSTGATNGARYRIVRTASSTGAFNLSVGGLKNLTAGQWCDVQFNGSIWILTAYGSL